MAVFGLLHGGFEGAWCWDLLSPEIGRLGHQSIAVDLPIDDINATWDDHATVALQAFPDPDTVIVAHSRSGRLVPRLLERGNFRNVILLSAAIPGGTRPAPYQSSGIPLGRAPAGAPARAVDELGRSLCTDAAAALLFSDCRPEVIAWAMANVRPQHDLPLPEDTRWPDVNVGYVYGDRDAVVDPAWIRFACRDRLGIEPVELAGGHSLFLSQPRALARTLVALSGAGPLAGERDAGR